MAMCWPRDNSWGATSASKTDSGLREQPHRVAVIHLVEHLVGQIQATQQGRGRSIRRGLEVGVGDRAAALPGTCPQSPLTPVTADIMLTDQVVTRDQVRAKEK